MEHLKKKCDSRRKLFCRALSLTLLTPYPFSPKIPKNNSNQYNIPPPPQQNFKKISYKKPKDTSQYPSDYQKIP